MSTDGGMTFAVTALGPQCPNSSALVGVSATVAIGACTAPGDPMEQTVDGGKTFVAVQSPPDQSGQWNLIGFTNSEDGYAFWIDGATVPSTRVLWHTMNGGSHWSEVTIPVIARASDQSGPVRADARYVPFTAAERHMETLPVFKVRLDHLFHVAGGSA